MHKKRSFLERLTGSVTVDDEMDMMSTSVMEEPEIEEVKSSDGNGSGSDWMEEEIEEGQLTVDVFQTPNEIIIKSMVAGVKPENLNINISREMVTIKGRREEENTARSEDSFYQELYWGSFSRTILLPAEVDPEEAEAVAKHGLLTIRLPKLDKKKTQKLRVKSA